MLPVQTVGPMDPQRSDRRTGILLVNLGSPAAPETGAVARYLREFLMDARVIDVPRALRWFLVHVLIVPRRAPKSAEAYRQVWTERGSPLVSHGEDLARKVEAELSECVVRLAMRYGSPSIATGLDALRDEGCDELVVFPLYPQYAASSTGSSLERVYSELAARWNTPFVRVVPPFYDAPEYLDALADRGRGAAAALDPDHTVFSFHGLPERHMHKSDDSGPGSRHCLTRPDCCASIGTANRNCYRAQCFRTAGGLVERLGLEDGSWEVTFQSRLGRTPWIQPYTDVRLLELAREGKRRVLVYSPSFVADCLETLEEIALRAREDFRGAGGDELALVPSLNSGDDWASAVAGMLRRTMSGGAAGAVESAVPATRA